MFGLRKLAGTQPELLRFGGELPGADETFDPATTAVVHTELETVCSQPKPPGTFCPAGPPGQIGGFWFGLFFGL